MTDREDPEKARLRQQLVQIEIEKKIKNLLDETKEKFQTTMTAFINSGLAENSQALQHQHQIEEARFLNEFKVKTEDIEVAEKYCVELKKSFDDALASFLERYNLKKLLDQAKLNELTQESWKESEDVYSKRMEKLDKLDVFLEISDLDKKHENAKKKAVQHYEERVTSAGNALDTVQTNKLKKNLDSFLYQYKETNEKKRRLYFEKLEDQHKTLLENLILKYKQEMQVVLADNSYLEQNQLQMRHEETKRKITDLYFKSAVTKKLKRADSNCETLNTKLTISFTEYQNVNATRRNAVIADVDKAYFETYWTSKSMYEESMAYAIILHVSLKSRDEELQAKHEEVKRDALEFIKKEVNLRGFEEVGLIYQQRLVDDLESVFEDYKILLKSENKRESVGDNKIWEISNEAQIMYRKHMKNFAESRTEEHLNVENEAAVTNSVEFFLKNITGAEDVDIVNEEQKLREILEDLFLEYVQIKTIKFKYDEAQTESLCLYAVIEAENYYRKLVETFLNQKKCKKASALKKENKEFRKQTLDFYWKTTEERHGNKVCEDYADHLKTYLDQVRYSKLDRDTD